MIYQHVKRYLKRKYTKPTVNFKWSSMDNIKFFSNLENRYITEEFSKEINEVKEAFKDFFEPVGKMIFRYSEESGIKLKIFPYIVKPEDSKHLKSIVKIILKNRKAIKYNDENNQITILGKIRREINAEISDSEESVNKKELTKHAIKAALELSNRDVVVQLKRKYIVKIFNKSTLSESKSEEDTTEGSIQDRYNGYTKEQIKETYNEVFKDLDTVEDLLVDVMQDIFVSDLDFRVIDNKYYEDRALKIIYNRIAKELNNYVSLDNDYIDGLTGYLMRENFYKIHELIAIELIERINEKNFNANQFLLFYNGKTILRDNKKYKIPSLETEDGRQWNNSSLIGICNVWMNTKIKRKKLEDKLMNTNAKLDEINEALLYIEPEIQKQESIIEKATSEEKKSKTDYTEIKAKLKYLEKTSLNSDEYFKFVKEEKKASIILKKLDATVKEAKYNLNVIKDANMHTYTDLESLSQRKKQILDDMASQDVNTSSRSSQMDPIMKSLIGALMSRKKLV